jgi:hypothetical protein
MSKDLTTVHTSQFPALPSRALLYQEVWRTLVGSQHFNPLLDERENVTNKRLASQWSGNLLDSL